MGMLVDNQALSTARDSIFSGIHGPFMNQQSESARFAHSRRADCSTKQLELTVLSQCECCCLFFISQCSSSWCTLTRWARGFCVLRTAMQKCQYLLCIALVHSDCSLGLERSHLVFYRLILCRCSGVVRFILVIQKHSLVVLSRLQLCKTFALPGSLL